MIEQIDEYLEAHRSEFEEDLCELLRIPSISADPDHRRSVRRAADWVADAFRGLEFETEVVQTPGFPVVLAQSPEVPGAPTVLVYGHYDVQPPDPLEEWISPPFEPTRRDGNVYARGATDDKGQMLTHIKSAQAWVQTAGGPPVNLKYLIEGEEEVGSEYLAPFIHENRERLACDCVVISDTSQFGPGQPAITYGLRGIQYYELRLRGPKQDLHSGTFGGAVTNPANALARMLSALVDEEGRIQVPEFYDDVTPLTTAEREQFQALSFREDLFMDRLDVEALSGETGFSTLERRWARPTFDISGLDSGYQGEGPKTVIPARATAKFSFRLVPDQSPEKITANLQAMFEELCPPGIRMELVDLQGSPGIVVALESPYIKAAARAIHHGFGTPPVFIREGGSIPVVNTLTEELDADVLLLGWGLDDDNTHSPNEKLNLADYHRGIKASAHLWHELSELEL